MQRFVEDEEARLEAEEDEKRKKEAEELRLQEEEKEKKAKKEELKKKKEEHMKLGATKATPEKAQASPRATVAVVTSPAVTSPAATSPSQQVCSDRYRIDIMLNLSLFPSHFRPFRWH